jgi:cytochrome c biogenesis protein CcdA/thiol-disulfide isomerase/thioredoxin
MTLLLSLFAAGLLTILLPCILPLVPIVLGVSVAGRRRARPLVTVAGMVASFVLFTFLLEVVLGQFVHLANLIRAATYYALFLFGVGFLTEWTWLLVTLAVLGAPLFFLGQGILALVLSPVFGAAAAVIGGRVAARIQQLGADVQRSASAGLGRESLASAFIVGLTLGLVWVPCAGPALGFAFALVRDQPGPRAFAALTAYAIGAGAPLLLIGYGGQSILLRARSLQRYSGRIKQAAGFVLVACAIAFQFQLFLNAQTWFAGTRAGDYATSIEARLFHGAMAAQPSAPADAALPVLPKLANAPEFAGLGPWYNSSPLTLASLRGKVVLVDFWTYSCVNCVRTFPELRQLWQSYRSQPFVIVGVHTPEFVFEKDPANVASAVRRNSLTYPIAQDNDYGTWRAFQNRYWPGQYLIDGDGVIRYTHFGEGGAMETDRAIRSLLAEMGRKATAQPAPSQAGTSEAPISPETYLASRGWDFFANREGVAPDDLRHRYSAPATLPQNHFALVGDWQMVGDERQVLRSLNGEIRYAALAGEVNLVLGIEPRAQPAIVEVWIDGKRTKQLTVDHHDLFNLYAGPYGEHTIVLHCRGQGLAAYAFTFGAGSS